MELHHLTLLAQDGDVGGGIAGGIVLIIYLAILALIIVANWKLFTKAGKPGWASIIPIYNLIVLMQIVGRPGWWVLLLLFVPCVNIVIALIVCIDLAKSFGQGAGFAIGIFLLGIVFIPLLAFGDYRYQGPAAAGR